MIRAGSAPPDEILTSVTVALHGAALFTWRGLLRTLDYNGGGERAACLPPKSRSQLLFRSGLLCALWLECRRRELEAVACSEYTSHSAPLCFVGLAWEERTGACWVGDC